MKNEKIGVGIIGAGGWAKYGHIPALLTLNEFELVAVAARTHVSAKACAEQFGIPYWFNDENLLINHTDVQLVVILAPAPEHARLAKAVIAAGKDVYTEWPLTTTIEDSEELLALAEEKGVKHVIGLQRRFSPSASYVRDLIKQGYVGKIRGVHMKVNVDAFPARMSNRHAWAFQADSFTNVLSVYAGHFGDLLFQLVGFPKKLSAIAETHFPFFTVEETGERVPNGNPNEIMIIGTLEQGGLFSIQIEGGQRHTTGLEIEITGTEGVLKVSNPKAFENKDDNLIEGINGAGTNLSRLSLPKEYCTLSDDYIDMSSLDVAYLYDTYARDKKNQTFHASSFKDAVRIHKFIDEVMVSYRNFMK